MRVDLEETISHQPSFQLLDLSSLRHNNPKQRSSALDRSNKSLIFPMIWRSNTTTSSSSTTFNHFSFSCCCCCCVFYVNCSWLVQDQYATRYTLDSNRTHKVVCAYMFVMSFQSDENDVVHQFVYRPFLLCAPSSSSSCCRCRCYKNTRYIEGLAIAFFFSSYQQSITIPVEFTASTFVSQAVKKIYSKQNKTQ